MSISYTILGVLMDAPTHGYSIKKTLLESFSPQLDLNDGQLYPALARLEQRGWIEKEVVEQRSSPNKHRYRLTPPGRREFLRWLESAETQDAPAPLDFFWRNDFLQKTGFFRHLETGAVRSQVREKLTEVSRCLADLERSLETLPGGADPYRRMVVDYGIRYQRMRREWLKELLVCTGETAGGHPARSLGRRRSRRRRRIRMFDSVEDVQKRLLDQDYICSKNIATVVFLAAKLQKPVLVEGPAGVGKTELGKAVASALKLPLTRLQCYEGLDESKALYEWEYSKQLLYTQMLRDKIGQVIEGATDLRDALERIADQDDVFFSEKFIVARPLLQAITSDEPILLLIDEVDKSDPEFEAFLLEVLSDYTVSVPEIGTIQAKHIPVVFLTSNDAREMTDALKRRCLHLYIDFPSEEEEVRILELKVPGIGAKLAEEIVALIHRIRDLDLKKAPSIAETLDWARALMVLNADELEAELVSDTLNIILKHQGDIAKAQTELNDLLRRKAAETAGDQPAPAPAAAVKKSVLH